MQTEGKAKKIFSFPVLVVLSVAFLFIWVNVFTPEHHALQVIFCDVGQGDAALLEFPDGKSALVDGGPDKKVLECLGKNLPFYRKKIDLVFVSHPDADHVSGLSYVLQNYDVGRVIESGIGKNTVEYQTLASAIKAKGVPETQALRGTEVDISPQSKAQILMPATNAANSQNINNSSEIVLFSINEAKILFTGDMEAQEAAGLAGASAKTPVDILKIPHHGSKYSLDDDFYAAFKPRYAVISVGAKNRYGHPHKEVLDYLSKAGIKVYRTDKEGDIKFQSDGQNLVREN